MPNPIEQTAAATDEHTEAYHQLPDHPANEIIEAARIVGRRAFSDLTEQPGRPVMLKEMLFGILMFVFWTGFFSLGAFVPTKEARQALIGSGPPSLASWLENGAVAICCYTLTNILFLSCFASMLGCMMCRWRVRNEAVPKQVQALDLMPRAYSPERLYLSAFLRGFFLYLLVVSGLLVVSNEGAVQDTTFSQYIRLAGFISAFSFAAGYDPSIIYRLISRISDVANSPLANKSRRPAEAGTTSAPRRG
jgi:hypothetical protein